MVYVHCLLNIRVYISSLNNNKKYYTSKNDILFGILNQMKFNSILNVSTTKIIIMIRATIDSIQKKFFKL